jgi:hypothetical protein
LPLVKMPAARIQVSDQMLLAEGVTGGQLTLVEAEMEAATRAEAATQAEVVTQAEGVTQVGVVMEDNITGPGRRCAVYLNVTVREL